MENQLQLVKTLQTLANSILIIGPSDPSFIDRLSEYVDAATSVLESADLLEFLSSTESQNLFNHADSQQKELLSELILLNDLHQKVIDCSMLAADSSRKDILKLQGSRKGILAYLNRHALGGG